MKRVFSIICLCASGLAAAGQEAWTVQDCIAYALEHNRSLKQQHWSLRSDRTRLTEAVTAFLPSMSAGTGVNYSFGRSLDPETNTYNTVSNFNNNYSLSLSLPLFQGGRLVQQLKMQLVQQQYGKTSMEELKDQTALSVMNAFAQVVYYRQLCTYVREKREESRLRLRQVCRQRDLGLKSTADVALIEAQYAQDDYDLTHTENLTEEAVLTLKQQMNFPVGDSLAVSVGGMAEGQVEVARLKEDDRTDLRKGAIGFVFQSFNLIDELTVYENVELPLIYAQVPARQRRERVNAMLDRMKMSHRAKHYPQQLSGGQQQRVAIARAVVTHPQLILADEPTGNLDSAHGREVIGLLEDLNSEGTTIVMVTHNSHDAASARRIIHLFDGCIVTETED